MKKIMFNDNYGLTKAVLEGRKTQTRRIVTDKLFQECRSNGFIEAGGFNNEWETKSIELLVKNSLYKIGEEVAVAQSYFDCGYTTNARRVEIIPGHYAQFGNGSAGWNNKMFVKAEYMPHHIRITNVRVERLRDISDEDCIKEGINNICDFYGFSDIKKDDWGHYNTPREAFAALIGKCCGKGTWGNNPWVFVYDFELIK